MVDDFAEVFNLFELLWEEHVGKRYREGDRQKAVEDARRAVDYAKSKALLLKMQEQE